MTIALSELLSPLGVLIYGKLLRNEQEIQLLLDVWGINQLKIGLN